MNDAAIEVAEGSFDFRSGLDLQSTSVAGKNSGGDSRSSGINDGKGDLEQGPASA